MCRQAWLQSLRRQAWLQSLRRQARVQPVQSMCGKEETLRFEFT
jgi:hypothetical protein